MLFFASPGGPTTLQRERPWEPLVAFLPYEGRGLTNVSLIATLFLFFVTHKFRKSSELGRLPLAPKSASANSAGTDRWLPKASAFTVFAVFFRPWVYPLDKSGWLVWFRIDGSQVRMPLPRQRAANEN